MAGRAAGSLARQAYTIERSGSGTPPSCGSSYWIRLSTAGTESLPNGGAPVAAYTMTAPHANTSTAGPAAAPMNCSGAM